MNLTKNLAKPILALVAVTALAVTAAAQTTSKGLAVAYPWVFSKGTQTSRGTAIRTAEEVLQKAGFSAIPLPAAKTAWRSAGMHSPSYGNLPSARMLQKFGRKLKAKRVLYGSVAWHTRSIWVNAGPKTISTATVTAYVLDVATGKVVYKKSVEGRSDEKSNGYKIAAAVILTPLVTAVSGGPATPQEQRAVQIALGKAYHDWVLPANAMTMGSK